MALKESERVTRSHPLTTCGVMPNLFRHLFDDETLKQVQGDQQDWLMLDGQ